ncbi:MAG: chromosomal replication initiator protein DnaA [Bacteroidetes bacterium]|nr:chromosomal replication initiator protein DnaA [Bacteroidota bacterium]MBS1739831.1 chromosomal replication initiator protein DnaA [Bacteroidota bacterium]
MDKHLYNITSKNEAEAVWAKCLSIIKDNLNWRTYQTWFEPIKAAALSGTVLTLQVPSQFFYEWLEEHYVELMGKTIKRVLGREGQLEYRILMEGASTQRNPASINIPASNYHKPSKDSNYVDMPLKWDDPSNIKTPYAIPGLKRMQIDPQLNANYTFENYVEGDCNRVARSAGLHVAQKPGATSFNPLVIFGGVGWGKTHLAQAIGNEVRRLHPNKAVLYVSADKFINQFIDHSKNNEVNDFIHFYQLIDVLILDDIHLFVPAAKSQDVFFAIFNHLHQSGKQIILTSDTPPKDMEGIQERLLSRFRWGLNADIQAPGFETRQEILRQRMRREGLELSDDVVKYIAYNVQSNVRELEGALIALFAQSTLNRKEVDLDLAKRVMKNFVKTAARELTIENIQKLVCEYFHIPYDRLLAKTRKREVVQARQITMFLAKKFTKSSLKNIGEHFGGFDHTTVIHSCQTVENLMHTDGEYKENLLELQQKVQLASI